MKMGIRLNKVICKLLAICFMAVGINIIGLAEAMAFGWMNMQDAFASTYDGIKGSEIIHDREENIKHFELENGVNQAVVFGLSMHFREGNKWVQIDNSLSGRSNDG